MTPTCAGCEKNIPTHRVAFPPRNGNPAAVFLVCASCAEFGAKTPGAKMSPLDDTDTTGTDLITVLVRRYRALGAELAPMEAERAAIKARIEKMVKPGWACEVDGVPAKMTDGRRVFSPEIAVTLMSPELCASCVTTALDPKLVRKAAEESGVLDAAMIRLDTARPVLDLGN